MTREQQGKTTKRPVLFALAALVPLAIWGAWEGFQHLTGRPIVITGTIQAKEIPVASKVGGRIAKFLVAEGQIVHAGQPLVEFEVPELEAKRQQLTASIKEGEALLLELQHGPRLAEIEKARAAADQALANWRLLERGYRHEDVRQAKEAMEQVLIQLNWDIKEWKRFEDLAQQGAVSRRDAEELKTKADSDRQQYEAAVANYEKMLRGPRSEEIEAAEQQYRQAKAALKLLEEGTRYERIEQAKAQVERAKATLAEVNAQLRERIIVSPAEAEVSVMDLHAGEVFPPNKSLGTLTRLDYIWTRVYLPERELARVRVGQSVEVKVDAYPGKVFSGKIVQIPGVAEFTPRNVQTPEERSAQVFGLKVVIDNKERLLRGGMNAEVVLPPARGTGWGQMARSVQ